MLFIFVAIVYVFYKEQTRSKGDDHGEDLVSQYNGRSRDAKSHVTEPDRHYQSGYLHEGFAATPVPFHDQETYQSAEQCNVDNGL